MPNPESTPYTGDFADAFGNHLHVLAVANPSISLATFRAAYGTASQTLGDRSLKRDGYGIVRIDKTNQRFIIECWPWDADPTVGGQYPGWPYTLPFADA